jgi:predicted CXXCH cytochrome family protein
MKIRIAILGGLLAAALAAGVLLLGRSGGSGEEPRYVGRAACAECHAKEAALWEGSDHARAMNPAEGAWVLGRFDGSTHTAHGVTSTFLTKDGKPVIRTDGPDGRLQDYPVTHVFGADPLQQYLVEFPRGRIQVPGLCWDSRPAEKGGQRWFHLYPDAEKVVAGDVLHWTGPMQNWNFMCAECHVTDLRKNYDEKEDRFRTRWSELNVSCEACHGPGSAHQAWARRPAAERDADETMGLAVRLKEGIEPRWVFDPGRSIARPGTRRPTRAEVETCGRCHARRSQIWPEYRHGRPLADTHQVSLLEEGLYFADGQILDEVYEYGSFVQSRMHRASVTCSNCHEPHGAKLRLPGNALCGQCHQPGTYDVETHHRHNPGTPGASCVECHMPARTYMGVDLRRDHSFRVPRPDLTMKLGTPNACAACHAEKGASWAAAAVSSWTGGKVPPEHYGEAIHAGRTGAPDAAARLAAAAANPDFPPIARGTALSLLSGRSGAAAEEAGRKGALDEEILVRQGAATLLSSAPPETRVRALLPLVKDPVRGIRLAAATALAELPEGALPPQEREGIRETLLEWVRAQRFNADRAEAHLNLGNLELQQGRAAQAEAAFRKARALQPSLAAAHVNLAELLSRLERAGEAEQVLREGLASAVDAAVMHHALGLHLVRLGRRPEALRELRRAVDLAPRVARYAYVYAVGVDAVSGRAEALRLLEEAQQRFPADRDILSALSAWAEEGGDRARALRWARLALDQDPSDGEARRRVEALERGP